MKPFTARRVRYYQFRPGQRRHGGVSRRSRAIPIGLVGCRNGATGEGGATAPCVRLYAPLRDKRSHFLLNGTIHSLRFLS
jgi:hypothetical protein